jgi:hypothetical protein
LRYWIGNVDAETFANLVSDLFLLLAEPDRQGVLVLADHLAGEDWWDKHRLGYGVVITLVSLQHWASCRTVLKSGLERTWGSWPKLRLYGSLMREIQPGGNRRWNIIVDRWISPPDPQVLSSPT